MSKGKVYIVGAGPGDPQLITIKGLRCIREADVIVYDRLLDEQLLSEACSDAELIYAGKSAKHHAMKQSEINDLLISKAQKGKEVIRLKGGDPFVFGRGGEETQALAAKGIPFEIVPCVTSATAVPAYAGIPVTHRGLASSFAVVTGHEDPAKKESSIAWHKLATGADTLVVLMGVENLSKIVRRLIENGRPPATPAALISEGTRARQRTVVGTLADIEARSAQEKVSAPAVFIVGNVVRLRDKLRWFDNRPLFGKRVLVTRTRRQASVLSEMLTEQGAEAVEMPVIEIASMPDYKKLDRAIHDLSDYSWMIFTSTNGVEAFFSRLSAKLLDARHLKGVKICAIGPATSANLQRHGLKADYVPERYVSESVLDGFSKMELSGKRILLPRAETAGAGLVEGLTRLGAKVDEIAVYKTVLPRCRGTASRGRDMLLKGNIDIVTFTSSSTVRNLITVLGADWKVLNNTMVACIGPITAKTAAESGLRVDVTAKEHSIPGLVEAITSMLKLT